MTGSPARQQGFAIVLVLAALVVASVVAQTVLTIARGQATVGHVALDRLAVAARVEGAIDRVVFALLDPGTRARLAEDGPGVDAEGVSLSVIDVCGRLDLNLGDLAVLRRLVAAVDPIRAEAVVADVETVRASADGFVSVAQMRALPSVDAALAEALLPDVTVHCRARAVDPAFASPRLLAAAPSTERLPGPRQTFAIHAAAAAGPGTRVEVEAVVAITFEPGRAWRVVSWRTGQGTR